MRCAFRPTKHAKERMIENDFSKDTVIEVIERGIKRRYGIKVLSTLRGIEAVYLQLPCNYHVITVYQKV